MRIKNKMQLVILFALVSSTFALVIIPEQLMKRNPQIRDYITPLREINSQNDHLLVSNENKYENISKQISILNQESTQSDRLIFSAKTHTKAIPTNTQLKGVVLDITTPVDFNNDGILDIAAVSADEVIYFISGDTGATMYTNNAPTADMKRLIIGNFNNDSIPDVVAGGDDNKTYFINGMNGETMYVNDETKARIKDISVTDFTNDGISDVIVAARDNITYFIDGKNGSTLFTNNDTSNDIISDIEIGNFTNDEKLEVAIASYDGKVYFLDVETGATLYTSIDITFRIGTIKVTDFDNNGMDDLALGCSGHTVIAINGTDGTELFRNDSIQSPPTAMDVADFNNDNIPDIVVATNWFAQGIRSVYVLNGIDGTHLYSNSNFPGHIYIH